jgi:hypothetical protein
MYTALSATTKTLQGHLDSTFKADPFLGGLGFFGGGGAMVVSPHTPQEMIDKNIQGLSVWLYRVIRDPERLNDPSERIAWDQIKPPPLPLRLHYLMTPIADRQINVSPDTEQKILGKVLQTFHSLSQLRGVDLKGDFEGTQAELRVRLEPMSLEEITRVWEALKGSYQLSVSYEVTLVNIDSANEPEKISPVAVALPEYGVTVS